MTRHHFLLASCVPVLTILLVSMQPARASVQPQGSASNNPASTREFTGLVQDARIIRDLTAELVGRLERLLDGNDQPCDLRAYREAMREFERLARHAQEIVDREAAIRARSRAAPRPFDLEVGRINDAVQERLARWRERLAECVRRARPPSPTSRGNRPDRRTPGRDYYVFPADTVPGRISSDFFRLNLQFLDAAQSCDLEVLQSLLAQLERLAAEFGRLAEAAREAGSSGTVEARRLAQADRDIQQSLERARQQLQDCVTRAAAAVPPPTPPPPPPPSPPRPEAPAAADPDDEDPEYPDDDAPPSSATTPPRAQSPAQPPLVLPAPRLPVLPGTSGSDAQMLSSRSLAEERYGQVVRQVDAALAGRDCAALRQAQEDLRSFRGLLERLLQSSPGSFDQLRVNTMLAAVDLRLAELAAAYNACLTRDAAPTTPPPASPPASPPPPTPPPPPAAPPPPSASSVPDQAIPPISAATMDQALLALERALLDNRERYVEARRTGAGIDAADRQYQALIRIAGIIGIRVVGGGDPRYSPGPTRVRLSEPTDRSNEANEAFLAALDEYLNALRLGQEPPRPQNLSDLRTARAAALLTEARAAPRSCTDAALNAIIAQLEALLAEVRATIDPRARYTAAWEEATAAEDRIQQALREARALRDGACPPDTGGFIIVVPGYGEIVVPTTGIGVVRTGPPGTAPELFGAEMPGTVPQIGARAGYATGNGGFNLEAYYFEGSETRPFNVPSAAGTDTGRVNGALSPGGSSGIIGPFSLGGEVQTEGVTFGARASLEVLETSDAAVGPGSAFALRVFSYAQRSETTYSGLVNGQAVIGGTTFGFSQQREQEVDETRLGVGAEGLLEVRIGGGVTFTGSASGSAYYRSTDLDSVERNTCTFCPAADRDFTLSIRDGDNGFGVHGALRSGVAFTLSPRISFTVGGQIDYWSRVGTVFNPNSGDQVFFDGLRTALRITDAWSWSVGAGLIVRLGAR